jgi:hypothetical protein
VNLTDTEAEIMAGSFDKAPTGLLPQYELWTKRREEWLRALDWASQFDEDRASDEGFG